MSRSREPGDARDAMAALRSELMHQARTIDNLRAELAAAQESQRELQAIRDSVTWRTAQRLGSQARKLLGSAESRRHGVVRRSLRWIADRPTPGRQPKASSTPLDATPAPLPAVIFPAEPRPVGSIVAASELPPTPLSSAAELHELRRCSAERLRYELAVADAGRGRDSWIVPGICLACDSPTGFHCDWLFSDGQTPNLRERLECPVCHLNNRQRLMATLIRGITGPVFLFEQVTAFHAWAQRTLPHVVGSEYLGVNLDPGTVVDGIRHEDALDLSFDDDSFDLVVSNDVFEHVPDIDRALAECARVLRPSGRMLFTVPFTGELVSTVQRATLREGEIVHHLPPEYHTNPVDLEGSLVFYEHGWDILERCRSVGFEAAQIFARWSAVYGHLGGGSQLLFSASVA